jgi:hypothetical protein
MFTAREGLESLDLAEDRGVHKLKLFAAVAFPIVALQNDRPTDYAPGAAHGDWVRWWGSRLDAQKPDQVVEGGT